MRPQRFSCRLTSFLVLGAVLLAPVLIADVVILKSGTKIQCEVLSYRGGKLTLRKKDGKIVTGSIGSVAEIQFSRPINPPPTPAAAPPAEEAAAEEQEPAATVIPVATTPDSPPEPAEPQAPAPEPAEPEKPVHEYKTVSEIFRALPAKLQPHKEAWKKNPLMRTEMEKWFAENAVGCRLTLPPRELLGVDTEGHLTVELRDFSVGTVKYQCESGIKCQYWAAIPNDTDKYLEILRQLKADGKTIVDYSAEKKKEKDAIDARLSKLRIGKRDEKGRAIRRGSRIGVSGIISKLEPTAFMDSHPPHVRVVVELVEVTVTE